MIVMNISFTLQSMATCTLTSWLSVYRTKIRQILSAGRSQQGRQTGQRQHVVHTLSNHTKQKQAASTSRNISCQASRDVHQVTCSAKLVIDPFVGIGSAEVGALRLGIPFVGFEIHKEYLDAAIDRITQA